MTGMDVLWIDRKSKNSRQEAMDHITNHGSTWKMGDRPLLVFPEGVTGPGKTLLPFRQGVFRPGKPIRPVIMLYTGAVDITQPSWIRDGDLLR